MLIYVFPSLLVCSFTFYHCFFILFSFFFIPPFLPLSSHFYLLSFVRFLKAMLPFRTSLSKLFFLLFFGVSNGAVFNVDLGRRQLLSKTISGLICTVDL